VATIVGTASIISWQPIKLTVDSKSMNADRIGYSQRSGTTLLVTNNPLLVAIDRRRSPGDLGYASQPVVGNIFNSSVIGSRGTSRG
jgi:hypothetical protein